MRIRCVLLANSTHKMTQRKIARLKHNIVVILNSLNIYCVLICDDNN